MKTAQDDEIIFSELASFLFYKSITRLHPEVILKVVTSSVQKPDVMELCQLMT